MSDKTSDKRYKITLTENQLALVGTAVEGMMNDLISRKALCDYALNQKDKSVTPNDIMRFPSAQPEIIRCKNCRNNHWCNIQEAAMAGDNFFCGAAERRTDG